MFGVEVDSMADSGKVGMAAGCNSGSMGNSDGC